MQILMNAHNGMEGILRGPSDKSITHRALILGALATGTTTIKQPLASADITSTMNALRLLGVEFVTAVDGTITVISPGMANFKHPKNLVLDMGNSGTSTRLLVGVFAGLNIAATFIGDASLSMRPMARIIKPLSDLGAHIVSENNHLPLTIIQGITAQEINFDLPIGSAQVKNAILLAGLTAGVKTTIKDQFGTRNHTELMLPSFGVDLESDYNQFEIPAQQVLTGTCVTVPADISAAAFWLVASSIVTNSVIKLKNININPTRSGIIKVLKRMKAQLKIDVEHESLEPLADIMVQYQQLEATTISGLEVPSLIDEIPIIVLAATQAIGQTIITGAQELAVKETNRIQTVTSELTKLGADVTATADGFIVNGPTPLHVANKTLVNGHGDHRIAMMLAIAALITTGEVELNDPESVEISYPNFFADLATLIKQ